MWACYVINYVRDEAAEWTALTWRNARDGSIPWLAFKTKFLDNYILSDAVAQLHKKFNSWFRGLHMRVRLASRDTNVTGTTTPIVTEESTKALALADQNLVRTYALKLNMAADVESKKGQPTDLFLASKPSILPDRRPTQSRVRCQLWIGSSTGVNIWKIISPPYWECQHPPDS
jgi:hypothetical protein